MIDAVTAAGFLGRQVHIQNEELLLPDVQLVGLRTHPENPAVDYLAETASGHVFQGSTLVALEAPHPLEDREEEPVPHV
jgi:hypothetical protein